MERQVEPLVLDSEISGLPNRHAFLKLGNHVSRFAFDSWNIPLPSQRSCRVRSKMMI